MPKVRINVEDVKETEGYYHESLPENLVERIKRFVPVFKEVYPISLEQWIDGFRKDLNPESEIAVWEKMAERFEMLCKKRRAGTETEKKQIFGEVLKWADELAPIEVSSKTIPRA